MNRFKYKQKIFLYLCVLSLTLIASSGLINYVNTYKLLISDAQRQSVGMIEQLKNSNDMALQNARHSLMALIQNSDINMFGQRYAYMEDYKEKKAVYDSMLAILNMDSYFTACYVYYPALETLVDVNANTPQYKLVNESPMRNQILHVYEAFSRNQQHTGTGLYSFVQANGKTEWMMVVTTESSVRVQAQPLLMVAIDSQYFFRSLSALNFPDEANLYISNTYGEWIDQAPPQILQDFLRNINSDEKNSSFLETLGNTKQIVTRLSSEKTGLHYVYVIPFSIVSAKLRFLLQTAVFVASICLLLGLGMATVLTGKIHFPLEKISIQLAPHGHDNSNDIVTAIETGVDALLSANKTLQQQIHESESVLKNTFLKEILENGHVLREYNMPFLDAAYFIVAVLSVEESDKSDIAYNERQMLLFGIYLDDTLYNHLKVQKEISAQIVKINPYKIAIILGMNSKPTEETLIVLLQKVHSEVSIIIHLPVTLGYSQCGKQVSNLSELYLQASKAAEYRLFLGGDTIIAYCDLPNSETSIYSYPWKIEHRMLSFLHQGQAAEMLCELDLFSDYLSKHTLDTSHYRFSFALLLTDIIEDIKVFAPDFFDDSELLNEYHNILDSRSATDIEVVVSNTITKACNLIALKKTERTEEVALAVTRFLDKNYKSAELSLDFIAEQLGFSISYISKRFKLAMGVSIKDYITQKRIDTACELLVKTTKKAKEIGEEIGYPQQRSFIEIFKKRKGMTPSDYRNHQRSK